MVPMRQGRATAVATPVPFARITVVTWMWLLLCAALACLLAVLSSGCMPATGGGGGGGAAVEDESEAPEDTTDPAALREIEEADIVKYEDGYFYLANRYRGLRIIDARTIERPEIVGGVALTGRGVELYVDDDRAFVVTSADFYDCAGDPVSYDDAELADTFVHPDYDGSRISVIDVADQTDPFEIAHFDLDGFITATRRVGDVLYAAGNYVGPAQDADASGADDANTDGDGAGDDEEDAADDEEAEETPSSTTGEEVTVGEDGTASWFVISPGRVRAEYSVVDAEPESVFQVTVTDGNVRPSFDGIPGGAGLPLHITVDGDLEPGTFTATISCQMKFELIDEQGLEVEATDLILYRYDENIGLWTPAATGNNVGLAEPTDVLGEYGYSEWDNPDFHSVWAVVDTLGEFTVGPPPGEDLTVQLFASAGGTLIIEPEQAAFDYGTVVTVTAVAEEGYRVAEWSPAPAWAQFPSSDVMQFVVTEDLMVGTIFELIPASELGPHVFVVSINIADPDNIQIIDRVDVIGDSLDIHVTQEAIYVLGDDPTMSDTTRVTYVDISDPDGDVEERDSFRVPGLIENRFFVDAYQDVFRIVTEDWSRPGWGPVVALYTYDVSEPDDVTRIGELTIETDETLRSVRFDGERGYAVTFQQVDPLFVLDLADPTDPIVAGQLKVPGWSTHLVPLGDRLVGVGFDDTAGFRPALALYDVSNPSRPQQLDRLVLGEMWSFDTTSEATVDEKALKVLEGSELILLPISSYDEEQRDYTDSLQLIDLKSSSLRERGLLDHRGLVRRADVTDRRLWVLSDEAFQVADIDDRDEIISLATVDIISEQELLDAGLTDCVDSARYDGFLVDQPFFDGGGIFAVTVSPCGAAGMIGLLCTALGIAGLRLTRSRRKG